VQEKDKERKSKRERATLTVPLTTTLLPVYIRLCPGLRKENSCVSGVCVSMSLCTCVSVSLCLNAVCICVTHTRVSNTLFLLARAAGAAAKQCDTRHRSASAPQTRLHLNQQQRSTQRQVQTAPRAGRWAMHTVLWRTRHARRRHIHTCRQQMSVTHASHVLMQPRSLARRLVRGGGQRASRYHALDRIHTGSRALYCSH